MFKDFFDSVKILLFVMFLVLAVVTAPHFMGKARAATLGGPPTNGNANQATTLSYTNWSTVAGTETFSPNVYDVRGWRYVTIQWKGVTVLGNYSGIAGTFKVYAGPTPTGPWSPVNIGTTALSYTADGYVTFENTNNYIKTSWTRTRNRVNFYVTRGNVGPY